MRISALLWNDMLKFSRPPNQMALLEWRGGWPWGWWAPQMLLRFFPPASSPSLASTGLSAPTGCVFLPASLITSTLSTPEHSFPAYYLFSLSSVSPHLSKTKPPPSSSCSFPAFVILFSPIIPLILFAWAACGEQVNKSLSSSGEDNEATGDLRRSADVCRCCAWSHMEEDHATDIYIYTARICYAPRKTHGFQADAPTNNCFQRTEWNVQPSNLSFVFFFPLHVRKNPNVPWVKFPWWLFDKLQLQRLPPRCKKAQLEPSEKSRKRQNCDIRVMKEKFSLMRKGDRERDREYVRFRAGLMTVKAAQFKNSQKTQSLYSQSNPQFGK